MKNPNLILSETDLQSEINAFKKKLGAYNHREKEKINEAIIWAMELHEGQKRASGEPYIIHPLKVAEILIQYKMDSITIKSALLHDVLEDTSTTKEEIRKRFGSEVEMLVNGVTKIDIMNVKNKTVQETETIRKMVFAMVKDIRVIFIKLADKRHNMNTLQYMPEHKQRRISHECLEIYAPLAGKLGMNSLKSELEDLSLKYISPNTYSQIKEFVSQRKEERKKYLEEIKNEIYKKAMREKIKVSVHTRAKHFYSIYQKMTARGKDLDEIFDMMGVRILVNSKNECYTMLGVVHQLWRPLEGRFKDYIAMPKENQYQSLHTTVMAGSGLPLEIQIRTHKMDETAEFGVAAHWIYKEKLKPGKLDNTNLNLVNKLKTLSQTNYNSEDFLTSIKNDILRDTIIVYTPKGDPFELPEGSTAIDFAYHVHSQVGEHCTGAKADGSIIPLTRPLKNTQTVEIITSQSGRPHLNWLKHTKTTRARSKIRHWLNKHDDSVFIDRSIVAKRKTEAPPPPPPRHKEKSEETPITNVLDESKVGITIGKERNMMIRLAGCCTPAPGDKIIGFVSRGRGIIVHRTDCGNIKGIQDFENRKMEVQWETVSAHYTQRFKIISHRKADLFSEIEGAIRKVKGHLISGSLNENDRGDLEGNFTIEMEHKEDFKRIVKNIRAIPSVMNIQKMTRIENYNPE